MEGKSEIEVLIAKLFSDSITPEEKAIVTAWLNESAENKASFAQLRSIWDATHPAFNPEEIDVKKAEAKVMEKITNKKLTQAPFFIWWQRVAAIMILPVMILMGILLYNRSSRLAFVGYQEITSPFGMSSKVDLPDGSVVWLNSGSKLKYPVAFSSNERNVYLSGEAYFKVHTDKKHPFIVETKNVKVRATGTQFNVEAYKNDTITAVTLVEGKVDVNLYGYKRRHLKPNQRMVLNSNAKTCQLIETDAKHWGVWKDGILAFRDEPLSDVFKRVGRTFNVDIKVADPVLGRQLYKATFEGESFEEILNLLKMSAPIQYKRIGRVKQQSGNVYLKEKIEVLRDN
jgi:Fe2+-dicitrate sensor, membrane component